MQTRSKLKPGQKGTKKLLDLYGSRLVCVLYRYDELAKKRFKTVEIIVEEVPWIPRQSQIKPETIVDLRIDYGEVELGRKVKAAGGKWNPAKRLWEIRYDQAVALDLEPRIQKEKASNTTNQKAQAGIVKASNTTNQKVSSIR